MGTAPALITILVCMEVPDAMFVKAHAASNCKTHGQVDQTVDSKTLVPWKFTNMTPNNCLKVFK